MKKSELNCEKSELNCEKSELNCEKSELNCEPSGPSYNTTTVNYLNCMGGMHSLECNSADKDISQFCTERDLDSCSSYASEE